MGQVESSAPSAETAIGEHPDDPGESRLSPEVRSRRHALWKEFDAVSRATAVQMDEFLGELLVLPPEATSWAELLHEFAQRKHLRHHVLLAEVGPA